MHRRFVFLLIAFALGISGQARAAEASAQPATVSRRGRGPMRAVNEALTSVLQTQHLDLRFRPGSRAEANAVATGAMMERELARICAVLEVKNDRRYRVFLFDDTDDFQGLTHADEFVEGFAMGNTIHVPFENKQVVVHELVHLVARAKIGPAQSSFFAEGLANALLEHSHGVQVHAVAKYLRTERNLPGLSQMLSTADFTNIVKKQRLNGYDIAASWMRFLLETHGAEKLKQYYRGRPPTEVYGQELGALETAWWARLDRYRLRPEVKALLTTRSGKQRFGTITVNPGDPLTLTATPPRLASISEVKWTKDGTPIAGVTGRVFSLKKITMADAGFYEAAVIDNFDEEELVYDFSVVVVPIEVSSRP